MSWRRSSRRHNSNSSCWKSKLPSFSFTSELLLRLLLLWRLMSLTRQMTAYPRMRRDLHQSAVRIAGDRGRETKAASPREEEDGQLRERCAIGF